MFVAAGFAVVVGPAAWGQWSGRVRVEIVKLGSVDRVYRVYRPSDLPPRPGLVIDLHAAGSNGFTEQAISGVWLHAARNGWIVAYPEGVDDGWEPYGCCRHDGVDDLAFLAEVIARLEASDGIDPNRVFLTGLSRGGMMAYRAACELRVPVAAIAVVAGNMADEHGIVGGVGCRPSGEVSVLAIHGTADTQVPLAGGGRFAPFTDVVDYWRELDGCAPGGAVTAASPWADTGWECRGGAEVRSIVIDGGHHVMPGAPLQSPPWTPAAQLDTAAVIADFFARHSHAAR
jgi:polyhydroxybutyrate depolymerase